MHTATGFKSLIFTRNAKLAHIGEHQISIAEIPGSITTKGNFLDDFFLSPCMHLMPILQLCLITKNSNVPSAYNPRRKTLLDSDWSRSFWTLSLLEHAGEENENKQFGFACSVYRELRDGYTAQNC